MTNFHAERARALVGCRFRAQGRDPATGLDCIGLVASVFGIPAAEIARDYRLRGTQAGRLQNKLNEHFEPIAASEAAPGDVLLFSPAADQLHLAVRTRTGVVHADAALRRVVERPGLPAWPILAAYRSGRR